MKIGLYRKFRYTNIIRFTVLILLFVSLFALFIVFLTHFKPVFQEKAVMLAKLRATEIINNAVVDVFSSIESYEFVNISKKEDGEISSVTSNTMQMNKLKAMVSKAVSEASKSCEDVYIYIPLGSLTKYPVLQGMGYRIPIKVSPDGVTKTDFCEEFTQAGINQVKNKVSIIVSVRISIISSIMTVSEEVTTEIPVTETVIAGVVPNYYGDKLSVIGR